MNEKNLISADKRSLNEARENGRKGGIKSGMARKRKKQLSDQAKIIMNLPVQEGDTESIELLRQFGMDPTCETISTVILCALMKKAISGDINAIKTVVDLASWIVFFVPRLIMRLFAKPYKKKKYKGTSTTTTATVNKISYKKIYACQNCGHTWKENA